MKYKEGINVTIYTVYTKSWARGWFLKFRNFKKFTKKFNRFDYIVSTMWILQSNWEPGRKDLIIRPL